MNITTLEQAASHLISIGAVDMSTMQVEGGNLLEACGLDTVRESQSLSRQIQKHGFIEGKDFCTSMCKSPVGRPSVKFNFTLNAANHVLLAAMTEQGKAARQSAINAKVQSNEVIGLEHELKAAEWAIEMLGLEGSAKLLAVSTVLEGTKVHAALPQYAIDSPTGIGSSEPTRNLTELLKENGYTVSAKAANKILHSIGFIEQLERKSTGDKTKKYWSVTDKGSAYGKNVTSPQNQKQTQPHWYVSKFNELAEAMSI